MKNRAQRGEHEEKSTENREGKENTEIKEIRRWTDEQREESTVRGSKREEQQRHQRILGQTL